MEKKSKYLAEGANNSPRIPKELSEAICSLPKDERADVLSVVQKIETARYSSPLPPPEFLKAYKDIISLDAPERTLRMAEGR